MKRFTALCALFALISAPPLLAQDNSAAMAVVNRRALGEAAGGAVCVRKCA